METAALWQFVVHKNGAGETWTWRRCRPDGTPLEISAETHANYGKVINDAIQHGFRPRHQPWVVTDSASVTHYAPCNGLRPSRKGRKAPVAARKKNPSRRSVSGDHP
jgi:hypothetical protein